MKHDELKPIYISEGYEQDLNSGKFTRPTIRRYDILAYRKSDVDEAIAEIKHLFQLSEEDVNRLTEKLRYKIGEIEMLKAENDRLKEDLYETDHHNIQYLCRMYGCDNVEAFHGEIKNLQTILIATERALWLARAKNASYNIKNRQRVINTELEQERPDIEFIHHHEKMKQKWMNAERLCLKKAEEYK